MHWGSGILIPRRLADGDRLVALVSFAGSFSLLHGILFDKIRLGEMIKNDLWVVKGIRIRDRWHLFLGWCDRVRVSEGWKAILQPRFAESLRLWELWKYGISIHHRFSLLASIWMDEESFWMGFWETTVWFRLSSRACVACHADVHVSPAQLSTKQ